MVVERVILEITLGSQGINLDPVIMLSCFLWPERQSHPLARLLPGGRELPVGAITAFVGGPLFLWLLRRGAGRAVAS